MVDTSADGLLAGGHEIIVEQLDEIELMSNRFDRSVFARGKKVVAWTLSVVGGLRNSHIGYTTAGSIFTKKFDY